MKKALRDMVVLLILVVFLCACQAKEEAEVIIQAEVHIYNLFMDRTQHTAEFVLKGEIPPANRESGQFSGRIVVEEPDGTQHTYKGLSYYRVEDRLLLYRGDPTKENGQGVLCWFDPKEPENVVLLDRNWCEPNPETEITAYLDRELSGAEGRAVSTKINTIPAVVSVVYVSAQEVLDAFVEDHEKNAVFSGIEAGDLRDRYRITVKTEDLEEAVARIEKIDGVEEVKGISAAESIRILGTKETAEKMNELLAQLPELPE